MINKIMLNKIKEYDQLFDSLAPFFLVLLFTLFFSMPKFLEPLWNDKEISYLIYQTSEFSFSSLLYIPLPLFFIKIQTSIISIRLLMIFQIIFIQTLIFILIYKIFKSKLIGYATIFIISVTYLSNTPLEMTISEYYLNSYNYATGKIPKKNYEIKYNVTAETTYKIIKLLYN